MFRLTVVVLGLLLGGCQPPDVKVSNLESFDNQHKRDGLVHGNLKVLPPSNADNAKITLTHDTVTLAKTHVLGIKSELYQPQFRLEGLITPLHQTDVLLPETASLQSLYVRIDDAVDVGDKLALFYHNTFVDNNAKPAEDTDDTEDTDTDNVHTNPPQTQSIITQRPVWIYATQQGRIQTIYPQNREQTYSKNTRVLTISDERELKFISPLPHDFKEHLSVGSAVNFSTHSDKTFSGQIEKIIPNPITPTTLDVHVVIKPHEIQKAGLTLSEHVSGYVNYGQKTVGVLVPEFAIFDEDLNVMDLNTLKSPPFKPATPIHAHIWTVKQDERLHLTPIELIEYRPQSDLYLVNGVSLTGLVVLTKLPQDAQGKKVRLK